MGARALLAAGLLALAPGLSGAAAPEPARIEATREGDVLLLRGLFAADAPPASELRYRLEVSKRGAAGTSSTQQGGAFTAAPGRTDTLSTVRLGVQAGDAVEARLVVSGPAGAVAEAGYYEVVR